MLYANSYLRFQLLLAITNLLQALQQLFLLFGTLASDEDKDTANNPLWIPCILPVRFHCIFC